MTGPALQHFPRRQLLRRGFAGLALGASVSAVAQTVKPESQPENQSGLPPRLHAELDGVGIMAEQVRRHQQFPYVYEQQTMVLIDAAGHRRVRRARRYMRAETDLSVKFLLVFVDPEEIRGVALLAQRSPSGDMRSHMHLPAFGEHLKTPSGDGRTGAFLGTDFAVEDLTVELASEFSYVRGDDTRREGVEYFQVEAYPTKTAIGKTTNYGLRRHLIRKDNFMITRTDFYDRNLRFIKRLSYHDLKRVYGESWRANMLVMNHERNKHVTLLKIDRRVYSRDYVPQELFEPEYLIANRHVSSAAVGELPEVTQ
jgi:hypothetical protein